MLLIAALYIHKLLQVYDVSRNVFLYQQYSEKVSVSDLHYIFDHQLTLTFIRDNDLTFAIFFYSIFLPWLATQTKQCLAYDDNAS